MQKFFTRKNGSALLFIVLAIQLCACERQTASAPAHQLRVSYVTMQPERIAVTNEYPGRVAALTVSEVRPQVGGIVTERLFEEGSTVKEGQVLYTIDPELFLTAYNEGKANLANAEANAHTARLRYERYAKLVKSGAVGVQDYDDAAATSKRADEMVASAREQLENARINLGYTKVIAPVSGEIGRSIITVGALVTKGQSSPMAVIHQMDPVYIDVKAPSSTLVSLRRALASGELAGDRDSVRATLVLEDGKPYEHLTETAHDGKPKKIEGRVLFSEVTVDQSTGTLLLRIRMPNPDRLLLPGMYVRATLDAGELQNALLVPQDILLRDSRNRPYVFVLTKENPLPEADGGQTRQSALEADEYYIAQRGITIGTSFNERWLVTSGLQPGDMVLTDNLQRVRPGTVVRGVAPAGAGVSAGKGPQSMRSERGE